MPAFSGFTAERSRWTTKSLMPSFTYRELFSIPNNRFALVSFSVNRISGPCCRYNHRSPHCGSDKWMTPCPASGRTCFRRGLALFPSQDQQFRNQIVGSKRIRAASGPRLLTVMRTRMSSGVLFAYSTTTSKYRSSSNIPVSNSSNSGSSFPRCRLRSTSSAYGNAACGYLYRYFMYEWVGVLSR